VRREILLSPLTLFALVACGGRSSLVAGYGDEGAPAVLPSIEGGPVIDATEGDEAASPGDDAAPDAPEASECGAPSLAGTWRGTIAGFKAASGSDAVTMTFSQESDASITGTLYFGSSTVPPPPIHPDVGYPPGFFESSATSNPARFFPDGFRHTVYDVVFDGVRLRLRIWAAEVWKVWCTLQTSYLVSDFDGSPPEYGCVPRGSSVYGDGTCSLTAPGTNAPTPVDCGQLALCTGAYPLGQYSVCQCTATGCAMSTNPDGMPDIGFDMQLSCDRLDGSASGNIESLGVHLARDP
jgi:hypothetical protein